MRDFHKSRIGILTSIIGYGVYFPGLLIKNELEREGFEVDVFVFERLFRTKSLVKFNETKRAFKKNYRLAQVASQLAVDVLNNIDEFKILALLGEWNNKGFTQVLCLSGLWIDVLSHYRYLCKDIHVSCLRIDAGRSKVWDSLQANSSLINQTFNLFDLEKLCINFRLNVPEILPLNFRSRDSNIVVHGGGWGIGINFVNIAKLIRSKYSCSILINSVEEITLNDFTNARWYLNDPNWDPLLHDGFPAFGEVSINGKMSSSSNCSINGTLDLISRSICTISKPGGMSLAESLVCGTPLIFTEAMGENESGNMLFWKKLSLGIEFTEWESSNFSIAYLEEMHRNLELAKSKVPSFTSTYINFLRYIKL